MGLGGRGCFGIVGGGQGSLGRPFLWRRCSRVVQSIIDPENGLVFDLGRLLVCPAVVEIRLLFSLRGAN